MPMVLEMPFWEPFLANLINNKNIEQSLRDAISYASEVCKTNGPRLE